MSTWPSARRKKGQEMLVGRGIIGERLEDSKAGESQINGHEEWRWANGIESDGGTRTGGTVGGVKKDEED